MKIQKTFESSYSSPDESSFEWLRNLSRCFNIKRAKFRSYIAKRGYDRYRCKVEVEYE